MRASQLLGGALRAYAAGIVPAGPDQLLPGEDDGKGHAHAWPDLPVIPDSIDRSPPGLKLLNEADTRLRDIHWAWEHTAAIRGRPRRHHHCGQRPPGTGPSP